MVADHAQQQAWARQDGTVMKLLQEKHSQREVRLASHTLSSTLHTVLCMIQGTRHRFCLLKMAEAGNS